MRVLSVLFAIIALDAVIALARVENMYTLKSATTAGAAATALTLVVCLLLGALLWGVARANRARQLGEPTQSS
jgi:hypothetical protein